jgi:hypothetical protein
MMPRRCCSRRPVQTANSRNRNRGGQRAEERAECWRRGLNYPVTDPDDAAIESDFCHGVRVEGEGRERAGATTFPIYSGIRKPHLFLGRHRCRLASAQHAHLPRAGAEYLRAEGLHKARQAASTRARGRHAPIHPEPAIHGLQETIDDCAVVMGISTIHMVSLILYFDYPGIPKLTPLPPGCACSGSATGSDFAKFLEI